MMKIVFYMIMLNFILYMLNYYNFIYMSLMKLILILFFFLMTNYNEYYMMIYSNYGFDMFSMVLVLLTLWIMAIVNLLSLKIHEKKKLMLMFILLEFILLMNFFSINLFSFYLFFEFSLVPIFMVIMGWGYQPERLKASFYMIFYTMFFSLPFLMFLLLIFLNLNSLDMMMFNKLMLSKFWYLLIYLFFFMIFLVKLPMFIFHNWLPKAHVEAPVSGSVILAAIMLKLGGYGIIRMSMLMNMKVFIFNDLLMVLSIFGMVLLSMLSLRHFDMKVIVAYSSVVHMGMMLLGLFSMKIWGLLGGLMMMISHGLCSSSMFIMVNYLYERSHSRSLLINKGSVIFLPSFMIFWFMLCMNNMASPPSLNLVSEVMIVFILMNWGKSIFFFIMLGMFLSACYSLYLFSYVYHGSYNCKLMKIYSMSILEFMVLFIHLILLNLMILKLIVLI
uniref:NADH dehydrogenase subunit 4 n=1 Tax=Lamennaisia ambigua TaxID=3064205 RepID=UPI00286C95CC|nr:NADH dehydrogenase subunit 4 [Lamennaisia ambigua]WKV28906.1 NADH dehydrogenase subunit 4 [Lamennaisia ambigua]